MSESPQKKVKRFAPKKGGPTIAQSSKRRAKVPVPKGKSPRAGTPPKAKPESGYQPPPAAQAAPPTPQPTPVPVSQPAPAAPPAPPPAAQAAPPPPQPTPVPVSQPAPAAPSAPPPAPAVIQLAHPEDPVSAPTQVQAAPAPSVKGTKTGSLEKASQRKVLQGKPANQTEAEDLRDEVASYLEVCDSCLSSDNTPKDIVDVVHMLVRSLNMDVVTIALLDDKQENLIGQIASRGYNNPPGKSVVACWEKAIIKGEGIDWKRLMKVAGDTQIDLAYWIVQEGLDSIGYVPIRDNKTIYGFLFVAAMEKKTQSSLTSLLLDACGSRIGMASALRSNKGDWPESVLNLTRDIRNQFTLLMGYFEMFREASLIPPEELNSLIDNCNRTVIESTQMLDSMMSEAAGE